MFGDPYKATLTWAFKRLCEYALAHDQSRVAIVHEISSFPEDIIYAFEFARRKFPSLRMSLAFGAKADFIPLQAADLLGYEGYKMIERGTARRPLAALYPTGKRMLGAIYGKDDVPRLAAQLQQLIQPLVDRQKDSLVAAAGDDTL